MKIRSGFVSNSSSSSFVCFGYKMPINYNDYKHFVKVFKALSPEQSSVPTEDFFDEEPIDRWYDLQKSLEGVSLIQDWEEDIMYVGYGKEWDEWDAVEIILDSSAMEKLGLDLGMSDKPKLYAGTLSR